MAANKFLDYAGLQHLVNNYIINKKTGTTVGDILYVSSVASNIPTYSRLGIGTEGQVLKVVSGVPAWATDTVGVYYAGTGLTLDGTTFNHSNSVTAQTTQALYPITYDAQGHITGGGTAITALPNPYGLSFKQNGSFVESYIGSAALDIDFVDFTIDSTSVNDTLQITVNAITTAEINALFS